MNTLGVVNSIVLPVRTLMIFVAVILDKRMVLVLIVSPDMVINPISRAVNRPLVLEVNVLIVEPVAVEKNKFCATKLRATYISLLTFTIFDEILIIDDALIYNISFVLLIVDTLTVLVLTVSPDIVMNPISTAVNLPLVFDVNVLIVEPVAVEKNKFCATKLRATYMS